MVHLRILIKHILFLLLCHNIFTGTAQINGPRLVFPSGHLAPVNAVAFSVDGKYVLTGSSDLSIRVWESASGKEVRMLSGAIAAVSVVKVSPDGKIVLGGCENGQVLVWNYESGLLVSRLSLHSAAVTAIDFFSNTKFLSGSMDRSALLYDLQAGKTITSVREHKYTIHSVAYFPDGGFFMTGGGDCPPGQQTGSEDPSVKMWDLQGNQVKTFRGGWLSENDDVNLVGFSADGQLAFAGYPLASRLFDISANAKVKTKVAAAVKFGCISQDRKMILSGAGYGVLELFDFATGKKLLTYTKLPVDSVSSVAFSPDGSKIACGAGNRAFVLDAVSGEAISRLEGKSSGVLCVGFSPFGKYLATGGTDASIKIWDMEAGSMVKVLGGQTQPISSLAFSPDNKKIAAASMANTGNVYDINSENIVYGFNGGSGSVLFSADGTKLLTVDKKADKYWGLLNAVKESKVLLYNAEDGKLQQDFHKKDLLSLGRNRVNTCAVFSPDGKIVYVAGSEEFPLKNNRDKYESFGEIQMWNAVTGKYLKAMPDQHNPIITCMDISADGKLLVTGNNESSIYFWNRAMGKQTGGYNIHTKAVSTVNFSADGKYLLTASYDKTSKLMDIAAEKTLQTLKGHEAELYAARFSPDGKYIVTVSWDNSTRLWNASTGQELARLVSVDRDQWFVITPSGYFDGSEKALKTIYYSYNDNVFALEQLKPKYYKKGLLPVLLGYTKGDLNNIQPFSVSMFYPQVSINNAVNARNPVLSVQVNDLGGGIGKVLLQINGEIAYPDIRVLLKDKNELAGSVLRISVPLATSKLIKWGQQNDIVVLAYNRENSLCSPAATVHFEAPKKIK